MDNRTKLNDAFGVALEKFDFETVHSLMTVAGWKWNDIGRTPTALELKTETKALFHDLCNDVKSQTVEVSWIQRGGLRVIINRLAGEVEIDFVFAKTISKI